MARGRMISASIGESRKFAALESDLHRLIYLMVLPHVDKAGRFEADSIIIRAKCLTRLDVDATTVEAWLKDAARTNLLRVYEAAGIRVLEIVDFLKHNSPHHKEPESDLPPPESGTPCYTQETMDGPSMSQARAEHEPSKAIREVKEREVKGKEREHPPTPLTAEPPSPELVEAAPRRELSRSSKGIQKGKARDLNAVRAIDQPFVDAWNENRGPLPSVLSLDQGRRRHLDKLRAELGDEALDVFTDATKQLAREPFYRQKGYGLTQLLAAGNLLTWAEKWRSTGGMSDQDRRLADKARAVADAIGGL